MSQFQNGHATTQPVSVTTVYSYDVGGKKYFGERIQYGYSQGNLLSLAERGQNISVFFQPYNPSQSVLLSGYRMDVILDAMVSPIGLLLAILLFDFVGKVKRPVE